MRRRRVHRFGYLREGVTAWIPGWKIRGWRTADKKPVKNEDLWRRIDAARTRHGGRLAQGRRFTPADPLKNRVDAFAVALMAPFKRRG